jgi:hypothetical protein
LTERNKMTKKPELIFRDASKLTKRLTLFCYIALFGCVVAMPSEGWNYLYLQDVLLQGFSSVDAALEASDLNDLQVGLVAIIRFFGIILFSIFFFMWIYRFACNTKALRDQDPAIKPGWCVGWFFVPIANSWMPYQKIKQLMDFDAPYHTPASLKQDKKSLLWFCILWVLSQAVSGGVMRFGLKAQETVDLILLSKLELFSNTLDIISLMLTLHLVRRLVQLQQRAIDYQGNSLVEDTRTNTRAAEVTP